MPFRQLRGQTFFQTWRQPDGEFGELNNSVDIEMNEISELSFNAHVLLRMALSVKTSGAVPVPFVSLRKASAHDAIINLQTASSGIAKTFAYCEARGRLRRGTKAIGPYLSPSNFAIAKRSTKSCFASRW